jgi:hypothetical protein
VECREDSGKEKEKGEKPFRRAFGVRLKEVQLSAPKIRHTNKQLQPALLCWLARTRTSAPALNGEGEPILDD